MLNRAKVIFWDFDGVLMDSNAIRDLGFARVLSEFPIEQVSELLKFHRANGGLSRYIKFRYFFENIREETVSDKELFVWTEQFSEIMKELLLNPSLLINDTLDFVKANQGNYEMHITSGSDQNELRFLCKSLGIDHLFTSIHGSPTPKKLLIQDLILLNGYSRTNCILIGDSMNDREAAAENEILFCAYNNVALGLYDFNNLS